MWTKKSHTHRLIEIANIGVHNREERDPKKNLLPRQDRNFEILNKQEYKPCKENT